MRKTQYNTLHIPEESSTSQLCPRSAIAAMADRLHGTILGAGICSSMALKLCLYNTYV